MTLVTSVRPIGECLDSSLEIPIASEYDTQFSVNRHEVSSHVLRSKLVSIFSSVNDEKSDNILFGIQGIGLPDQPLFTSLRIHHFRQR